MDALQDEVESLEAILMDDVKIGRDENGVAKLIETTIFPLVGDDSDQQYICVTLQVVPTPSYPDVSPEFTLVRPRGLDDSRLEEIRAACMQKLKESLGFAVVFDLIEVVREHLSGSNLPSGQCVVCLYGFSDGDEFTKTECFHYLHSYCLARHLKASRRNFQEEYDKLPAWQKKTADPFRAACPVCREPISDDSDSLKCAMPPAELENAPDFRLTDELKELQRHMANLFLRQKSRGAIIDVATGAGATVISIETPDEMRRRLEGKQRHESSPVMEHVSAREERATVSHIEHRSSHSNGVTTNVRATDMMVATSSMPHPSANEAANNSNQQSQSQYNRRHYRGGRRHQQHHHHHHHHQHHHHRDRERDREQRHEHQQTSSSHSAATATAAAAAASGAATSSGPTSSSGRQGKGQTAGSAHCR